MTEKNRMPIMTEQDGHCVGIVYAPDNPDYDLVVKLLRKLADHIELAQANDRRTQNLLRLSRTGRKIDYTTLSHEHMARYPKIRAVLAGLKEEENNAIIPDGTPRNPTED